jgi:hypothetical protein
VQARVLSTAPPERRATSNTSRERAPMIEARIAAAAVLVVVLFAIRRCHSVAEG